MKQSRALPHLSLCANDVNFCKTNEVCSRHISHYPAARKLASGGRRRVNTALYCWSLCFSLMTVAWMSPAAAEKPGEERIDERRVVPFDIPTVHVIGACAILSPLGIDMITTNDPVLLQPKLPYPPFPIEIAFI